MEEHRKEWFVEQQLAAREEIKRWPQWMQDAAHQAQATAPSSYWAQYYSNQTSN